MAEPNWRAACQTTDSPKRFIDPATGLRFYPIPLKDQSGFACVPGVTSILGCTATQEDKERLERWRAKEIAAGRDPNAARERGTRVHAGLEDWVRGLTPDFKVQSDLDCFTGMTRHLERYDTFLWNERPLVPGWERCWNTDDKSDPNRLARVWSNVWGYSGTPDFIAVTKENRQTVLGDFKTSNQPYFRCSGTLVPMHRKTGFLKYKKTVRQLCAYKMAVEEMFPDVHIDGLQIVVGLPKSGESQQFWISDAEIARETETFKQTCRHFWCDYLPGLQAQAATGELVAA